METPTPRKWYKKKRYIASLILATFFVIGASSGDSSKTTKPAEQVLGTTKTADQTNTIEKTPEVTTPVALPETKTEVSNTTGETQTIKTAPEAAPSTANTQPALSNNNYYTNVDGNTVPSPAYTEDNSIPAGASALCRDGTYSFSQNRRGTCSHHGGVAVWY